MELFRENRLDKDCERYYAVRVQLWRFEGDMEWKKFLEFLEKWEIQL